MRWRCFHCCSVFTSPRWAAEHFGGEDGALTACQLKNRGFDHLVTLIRQQEETIARYRAEDSDVMRAMYTMQSDHQVALREEEEKGYARGLRDGRNLSQEAA